MRRLVAVNRPAGEIMRAGIAHLDDEPGHQRCRIDENGRALLNGLRLLGKRRLGSDACNECERESQHSHGRTITYCGHAETHWPSIVFCESTIGMPPISALVCTVPV